MGMRKMTDPLYRYRPWPEWRMEEASFKARCVVAARSYQTGRLAHPNSGKGGGRRRATP